MFITVILNFVAFTHQSIVTFATSKYTEHFNFYNSNSKTEHGNDCKAKIFTTAFLIMNLIQ